MTTFRGTAQDSGAARTSATARAYERIKSDVLTCRIPPGAGVYEGELAADLGMSKTPVREALGMLAHEGFVEVRPRRGWLVTEVTLEDVREIYHLRLLLEPAAARLAATNASPQQLARLRSLAERSTEHDYEGRARHAHLFHQVLAVASGSVRLADGLVGVLDECQRLQFLDLGLEDQVEHTGGDHGELLDALDAGDAELAERLAHQQVEARRDAVLSAIAAVGLPPARSG